jgi:hypothetical protein
MNVRNGDLYVVDAPNMKCDDGESVVVSFH